MSRVQNAFLHYTIAWNLEASLRSHSAEYANEANFGAKLVCSNCLRGFCVRPHYRFCFYCGRNFDAQKTFPVNFQPAILRHSSRRIRFQRTPLFWLRLCATPHAEVCVSCLNMREHVAHHFRWMNVIVVASVECSRSCVRSFSSCVAPHPDSHRPPPLVNCHGW